MRLLFNRVCKKIARPIPRQPFTARVSVPLSSLLRKKTLYYPKSAPAPLPAFSVVWSQLNCSWPSPALDVSARKLCMAVTIRGSRDDGGLFFYSNITNLLSIHQLSTKESSLGETAILSPQSSLGLKIRRFWGRMHSMPLQGISVADSEALVDTFLWGRRLAIQFPRPGKKVRSHEWEGDNAITPKYWVARW